MANIVRAELRQSDLAGRFGGDELCLVLPETPLEGAYTVTERIRQRIAEAGFHTPSGVTFHMTVSLGLALWTTDVQDVTTLLARADAALYRAKSTRNRVVMVPERIASPDGWHTRRRLSQNPRAREHLFVVPGEGAPGSSRLRVERFGDIFSPHLHVFRKISTFVARMSQRAQDASATVFLVHAFQGVSHVAGHARDTCGTILDAYTALMAERLAVLGKVAASHAPKNQV